MDAALTNILQDKESQLRLVDLFPDRSSVFLLQEGALQQLPLRAGVAGAIRWTSKSVLPWPEGMTSIPWPSSPRCPIR